MRPTEQFALRIRARATRSFTRVTFGTWHMGTLAKPAATERFAVIVSVQTPVPEQSPDQPVNFEPEAGAALRVTAVPLPNDAEQVGPQLIPTGELVTAPEPEP